MKIRKQQEHRKTREKHQEEYKDWKTRVGGGVSRRKQKVRGVKKNNGRKKKHEKKTKRRGKREKGNKNEITPRMR